MTLADEQVLESLTGWILDRSNQFPSYLGSVDVASSLSTTILWNGTEETFAPIQAEANSLGITVSITDWPYSQAQIVAGSNALEAVPWQNSYGFTLADVVGLDPTFVGLTIEGTIDDPSTFDASAVESYAQSVSGLPVRLQLGVSAGTATGRTTDYEPFNAGGLMYSPTAPSTENICSSGFSINYDGSTHILTARHCDKTDYESYSTSCPNGKNCQYGGADDHEIGPGAARYLGGNGSPLVFEGNYDTDNYFRTVTQINDVNVGDHVCADGGNSGAHCNVVVTDLDVDFNDQTGNGDVETIKGVQQTSNDIAVIQGDSGGPVDIRSSNASDAYAVGMIQGYSGTTHTGSGTWPNGCGGAWALGANLCSQGILFTSIRTIISGLPGSSLTKV